MQILVGETNEILRKKSTKVEKINKEIKKLIVEMKETLQESQGVGLAAPQVGVNVDLVVVKLDEKNPIAILNPEILNESEEKDLAEEGCLSLPGIWGNVKRSKEIKLKFMDEKGHTHVLILKDLNARIALHEIDHLKGILFTDRVVKNREIETNTILEEES